MRVDAAFGFACARLVHLEFASAPDLYLGFPDVLRDALGFARSATLTHSELLRDEKNALIIGSESGQTRTALTAYKIFGEI